MAKRASPIAIDSPARQAAEQGFTGKRFGHLTTLHPVAWSIRRLGGRWLCRCDCGKEKEVRYFDLTSGHVRSCGCQKGGSGRRLLEDITGQTFGRLTVIRCLGRHKRSGRPVWLTRCSCGKEVISRASYLKTGLKKSCGCLRDEMRRNKSIEALKRKIACLTQRLEELESPQKGHGEQPALVTSERHENVHQ